MNEGAEMKKEKLYAPQDLAKIYGISKQQIIMDIRLGKLKGEQVGKRWIVRHSDLKDYRKKK